MENNEYKIHETQLVFATILVCKGCCCNREDKGNYNAQIDKLEETWNVRKLFKAANLIISGCTGHCNLANNVAIIFPNEIIWLAKVNEESLFTALVKWVDEMQETNKKLPVPEVLLAHRYTKYK